MVIYPWSVVLGPLSLVLWLGRGKFNLRKNSHQFSVFSFQVSVFGAQFSVGAISSVLSEGNRNSLMPARARLRRSDPTPRAELWRRPGFSTADGAARARDPRRRCTAELSTHCARDNPSVSPRLSEERFWHRTHAQIAPLRVPSKRSEERQAKREKILFCLEYFRVLRVH